MPRRRLERHRRGWSLPRVTGLTRIATSELVDALGRITTLEHQIARQTVRLRQGHLAIRQYLVEFGMTPSRRGRASRRWAAAPKRPRARWTASARRRPVAHELNGIFPKERQKAAEGKLTG